MTSKLHIGHLPGRKSIALYEDRGRVIEVLGYFRTMEAAERACVLIDKLVGITEDHQLHGWNVEAAQALQRVRSE